MAFLVGGPLECFWIQGNADLEIEAGPLQPTSNLAWLEVLLRVFCTGLWGAMLWCQGRPINTTNEELGPEFNVWV